MPSSSAVWLTVTSARAALARAVNIGSRAATARRTLALNWAVDCNPARGSTRASTARATSLGSVTVAPCSTRAWARLIAPVRIAPRDALSRPARSRASAISPSAAYTLLVVATATSCAAKCSS